MTPRRRGAAATRCLAWQLERPHRERLNGVFQKFSEHHPIQHRPQTRQRPVRPTQPCAECIPSLTVAFERLGDDVQNPHLAERLAASSRLRQHRRADHAEARPEVFDRVRARSPPLHVVGVGGRKNVDDKFLESRTKRFEGSFGHNNARTVGTSCSSLDGTRRPEPEAEAPADCTAIRLGRPASLTNLAAFPFGRLQNVDGKGPFR